MRLPACKSARNHPPAVKWTLREALLVQSRERGRLGSWGSSVIPKSYWRVALLRTGPDEAKRESMGMQVNFFADPSDAFLLEEWLCATFPDLKVFSRKGEPLEHWRLESPSDRRAREAIMMICLPWAAGTIEQLLREGVAGLYSAQVPCIEYSACIYSGAEVLRIEVGRFYWGFQGEPLAPEEEEDVKRILRWVRSRSRPLQSDQRFRIFNQTSTHRLDLYYGWSIVEPHEPQGVGDSR